MIYADSSAVVKCYLDEPGSARMRRVRRLVVSRLARVEVPSAIWRRARLGSLPAERAAALVADFEHDFAGIGPGRTMLVVGPAVALLADAAGLVRTHRLRACDAVQLASALAARTAAPEVDTFAVADADLAAAAVAEGFAVLQL